MRSNSTVSRVSHEVRRWIQSIYVYVCIYVYPVCATAGWLDVWCGAARCRDALVHLRPEIKRGIDAVLRQLIDRCPDLRAVALPLGVPPLLTLLMPFDAPANNSGGGGGSGGNRGGTKQTKRMATVSAAALFETQTIWPRGRSRVRVVFLCCEEEGPGARYLPHVHPLGLGKRVHVGEC